MRSPAKEVVGLDALVTLRAAWRAEGRSVVWTNGCFDLLHAGHARSLRAAAELGDVLIVGVNSDASVRALKGPSRPVVPQARRAELVAALACVDAVLVFDEATPERVLSLVRPDVHCKGDDYAPPSGKPIPERALVEGYGGRVAFLPLVPGLSTSSLLDKVRAPAGPTFLSSGKRAAMLLDRDGTLIEDAGYPRDPARVRLLPGMTAALRALSAAGFALAVVSNQSGVGRGLILPEEALAVHARFEELLAAEGVLLSGAYYCPHVPEERCACRKPSPGMLLRACADLGATPALSFMVGDKPSDVEAGRRAGCATILFGTPDAQADFAAAGWPETLAWILTQDGKPEGAT